MVKRNYSFANVQKPEVGGSRPLKKLKRSETERLFSRPPQQMASVSDHLWLTEFDNQAYQKSPEPLSSAASNLEVATDKSSSGHSLSLTSLSSPIHENSNSKKPTSFDAQSATSSDSDLELVSQTPPVVAAASAANANGTSTGISRAKILESVGVIVKNSSSAANLLLPPSSSSPTSSSSVSVYEAGNGGCGNEEPRLAFIGCETTLSSPSHSLSGMYYFSRHSFYHSFLHLHQFIHGRRLRHSFLFIRRRLFT